MIMEKIILVPVGGLANRMRAVASAVTLTYRVRRKLEVLWFRDWGLNAPFFKVFEEPELMNISFSETSCKHLLMYDRPRRRNFYLPKLFQKFQEMNIGWFFYIGGNDSMDTVSKLSRYAAQTGSDIRIMGEPKTIDNDLVHTDHTPGFGSAARYVASTVREITIDANVYEKKSVTIVEIMGRHAGWLTAASALARKYTGDNPLLIYLPEISFDQEAFLEAVEKSFEKNCNVIVCVSEGIHDAEGTFICEYDNSVGTDTFGHKMLAGCGKYLENLVRSRLGVKARSVELNVSQRCSASMMSATDQQEAIKAGEYGVQAALKGETGKMISFIRRETSDGTYLMECGLEDVNHICNEEKTVPLDWITPKGSDVTEAFVRYARPLIQGTVEIPCGEDGLPAFVYRK